MKKKKLKKLKRKIKYLEERVDSHGSTMLKMIADIQKIKNSKYEKEDFEKFAKLLNEKFTSVNGKIKMLDTKTDNLFKRTTTDYTQFSKISCDTCDYPDMSGCGT